MKTKRLTVAQATIEYLKNQYVERDGIQNKFFAGCLGILGHGNVAGIGQALHQNLDFPFYVARNEQGMVHTAAAFARVKNRLQTLVCTSSIGPGATNMLTGAAAATINRIPVLLIPGDIFATRQVAPVLQQLESNISQDISVNDCFKPVSKYWDRINRPEQLITALPEVMRVLTSQAETGTVTLCIPQDVQAEAFDFPVEMFQKRVWHIGRTMPDKTLLSRAVQQIKDSKRPIIIAGGGTIYSDATKILKKLVNRTGVPVAETFAGKGSLDYSEPQNLGAAGVTGTPGAIEMAREADLVIGVGTRYSDFTTISKSAFQDPNVRFININITEFDSFKHGALPLVGDAKAILETLDNELSNFKVSTDYREKVEKFNKSWDQFVADIYAEKNEVPAFQGEVIGAVNSFSKPEDIVICAAGSLPGDLHKLWRTRNPKGFHLEYGYSCMGYEIAGGLGAKMARPDSEIYVMVGDGSYLMMSQEIVTSIQEKQKMTIILLNNDGYSSIGSLSSSLGSEGFGTYYRYRNEETDQLDGGLLPIDYAANAASMGAHVIKASNAKELNSALKKAKTIDRTTVIYIEVDRKKAVPGFAWWDVAVAEVSEKDEVKKSLETYRENKKTQKYYL
ncbi:3D-(3,5/4)-trihydroxycyclohexane-1,2-dione acylhydrolase (decyclizing) [Arenibacter sp. M-2]|uniref:3D-(3,5/4)-trihydroxycyclohexane-1,2-dione acylhydrolase (decyclizing) n=1 Tax=unclassified Arenibacter TaxID=2615047 RepID=UPI000D764AF0|nr:MULTISPECIES: 3D-(3,5/4)-trihydroxycyclohexane-1,2-dione acylhydrolase (decyclizing) [unclassified Arenibacter]MDL5512099.1 3D-(3,5/4)-trihydroxycyclohexane-1,2-dione acylhydrolase (decyclizing) [Arenibacter sp. M-2]PXX26035.1 3D-(3,5/4)-trihydroxycyclohexane-1,2-dione hydrolase [Arenibacter sp. ARW7G5Y1]|tara:strand:- start:10861 stop:12720 length:1860 start_codon:yes stop_codon:yes gene_type:complete